MKIKLISITNLKTSKLARRSHHSLFMRLQSSLFVAVLLCRPSALSWPFSWRLKQRKLIKHSVYLVNGFPTPFFWSSFITNVVTEWYFVNCPTLCTLTSLTSLLYFSDGWNACWIFLNSRAQAMQWNSFTFNPGRKCNQSAASSATCGSGLLYKRQEQQPLSQRWPEPAASRGR